MISNHNYSTYMSPNVSPKISLMRERSGTSSKIAFEGLLASVYADMAHEFVFLSKFFAAPEFWKKLWDLLMDANSLRLTIHT